MVISFVMKQCNIIHSFFFSPRKISSILMFKGFTFNKTLLFRVTLGLAHSCLQPFVNFPSQAWHFLKLSLPSKSF